MGIDDFLIQLVKYCLRGVYCGYNLLVASEMYSRSKQLTFCPKFFGENSKKLSMTA